MKQGKRLRAIVQPWDLTATILEAFGLSKPPELIGESLRPLLQGEKNRLRDTAICGTNQMAQAMTGRWIYTVWQGQRAPSLIDLETDPLATTNLLAQHPDVVQRLHGKIVRFMRQQNIPAEIMASYR
jgi:arylsulfatase A-like enzyme